MPDMLVDHWPYIGWSLFAIDVIVRLILAVRVICAVYGLLLFPRPGSQLRSTLYGGHLGSLRTQAEFITRPLKNAPLVWQNNQVERAGRREYAHLAASQQRLRHHACGNHLELIAGPD
jgi:hypothetical protein